MKKSLKTMLPNAITFSRIILTIIFIVLLNQELKQVAKDHTLIYLGLIFLILTFTDFIDGKLARYLRVSSKFGSYFDVAADFIYILTSTIMVVKFRMLPSWFLIVIIIKLLEFFTTSKIIVKARTREKPVFIFDNLGRITAILFYGLPFAIVVINKYLNSISGFVTSIMVYTITIIAIISLIQRVSLCVKTKGIMS